jgi:hypothetical protein
MELEFVFLMQATYFQKCLGRVFKFSSTDFSHLSLSDLIVALTSLRKKENFW